MATAKKPAAKKPAAKKAPAPAKVEQPVEVAQEVAEEVLITLPADHTPEEEAPQGWVIKDRLYELGDGRQPPVFTVPTMHSSKKPLLYFDPEMKRQRELRYATNQHSPFVDEQEGPVTLGRIVMRDGILRVPKERIALQQLLSLYHPYTKDGIIKEYNPEAIATNDVDFIEYELAAMNLAKELDVEEAEAILRVEFGAKVSDLSSKEIKRDLLIFARRNPQLFLQLAEDDNVQLRNVGIKAVEQGILKISGDNRTFFYGANNHKVMTVPFGEHPYSALAAFFRTDEGMEVLQAIEKRL